MTRIGISTKGQVINIGNSIDTTNFKEIGTKNYWINNSVNIWNSLTILLGLKMEVGYTPIKMVLIRLYKNSLLTKFLRKFEIEILQTSINIKTFYQLKFMGKYLEEFNIDRIDSIIVEFPNVERLIEGVIKVFLQFDSEYLIIPMECMPIYGIIPELDNYIDSKRNRCPLTHIE
jgi:hypothetical protein